MTVLIMARKGCHFKVASVTGCEIFEHGGEDPMRIVKQHYC